MPSASRRKQLPPSLGEARQSQVLQLYGPGAMVDLPDYAVLIGGLDFWNDRGCDPVHEPRLEKLVRQATGAARVVLRCEVHVGNDLVMDGEATVRVPRRRRVQKDL